LMEGRDRGRGRIDPCREHRGSGKKGHLAFVTIESKQEGRIRTGTGSIVGEGEKGNEGGSFGPKSYGAGET